MKHLKHSLFIGRFQNFHEGHEWLLNQAKHKNIWIAIRHMPVDENNPKTSDQILRELTERFRDNPNIHVSVIPNVCSVEIGRTPGFEVLNHNPPTDIYKISGTKIRNEIRRGERGRKKI